MKPPSWKLKAYADPNISDRNYCLLKLGPRNIGELLHYLFLKLRYSLKE